MLTLCTFEHFILALVGIGGQVTDVGNIHNALDVVAGVAEILFQNVFHNIGAQVADVSKVVDRWAAGIHGNELRIDRDEFLTFSCS